MNEFLEKEFGKAIKLKKQFKKTEEKEWNSLVVLNELGVQIGHYLFALNETNKFIKENGRVINNKFDEISDILLQLCALCEKLNITKEQIKFYEYTFTTERNSIIDLMVLYGQLTECIMEKEGYRHKKDRDGFSRDEFIINRISKMFSILFSNNDSVKYIENFEIMINDAENFLKSFNTRGC